MAPTASAEKGKTGRPKGRPDSGKSVHEYIRNLPEDHPLHWKKVKEWIAAREQSLKLIKKFRTSKDRKERHEWITLNAYIEQMKRYLRGGIWESSFYGPNMEHRTTWLCHAPAYDRDGNIKREPNVFYMDIGRMWTAGDADEQRAQLDQAGV